MKNMASAVTKQLLPILVMLLRRDSNGWRTKASSSQKVTALTVRKNGIDMKKLLQLFTFEKTDNRVAERQLQALQAGGYFVEDIAPFIIEHPSWR